MTVSTLSSIAKAIVTAIAPYTGRIDYSMSTTCHIIERDSPRDCKRIALSHQRTSDFGCWIRTCRHIIHFTDFNSHNPVADKLENHSQYLRSIHLALLFQQPRYNFPEVAAYLNIGAEMPNVIVYYDSGTRDNFSIYCPSESSNLSPNTQSILVANAWAE